MGFKHFWQEALWSLLDTYERQSHTRGASAPVPVLNVCRPQSTPSHSTVASVRGAPECGAPQGHARARKCTVYGWYLHCVRAWCWPLRRAPCELPPRRRCHRAAHRTARAEPSHSSRGLCADGRLRHRAAHTQPPRQREAVRRWPRRPNSGWRRARTSRAGRLRAHTPARAPPGAAMLRQSARRAPRNGSPFPCRFPPLGQLSTSYKLLEDLFE
eukprot:scaffold148624_cov35-Tisochrysis_lutea.AAC.4